MHTLRIGDTLKEVHTLREGAAAAAARCKAKRVPLGGEAALTPLTPNHSCVGVDLSLLLKVDLATVC